MPRDGEHIAAPRALPRVQEATFNPITERYCSSCGFYKPRKGFVRINNFRTVCQDCNRGRVKNIAVAKAFAKRRGAV